MENAGERRPSGCAGLLAMRRNSQASKEFDLGAAKAYSDMRYHLPRAVTKQQSCFNGALAGQWLTFATGLLANAISDESEKNDQGGAVAGTAVSGPTRRYTSRL